MKSKLPPIIMLRRNSEKYLDNPRLAKLLEEAVKDIDPNIDFESRLDTKLTVGEQMTLFETECGIYFGNTDPVTEIPKFTQCSECSKETDCSRSTRRHCSPKCKQKAYRMLKRERTLARLLLESLDS